MLALREGPATVVRREDYAAPAYWIDTVDLCFDLDPAKTRVLNKMTLRRNNLSTALHIKIADGRYRISRYANILHACGRSGSINHTAVFYKNIKHLLSPYLICQFFLS